MDYLTPATVFQIALELWGALFSMALIVCNFILSKKSKTKNYAAPMHISIFLLLLADSAAWFFRGCPGRLGYWMVRIANPLVFLLQFLMPLFYTIYVKYLLPKQERKKEIPAQIVATSVIFTLGIFLVCNYFTNDFYFFDNANCYHRGRLLFLFFLLSLICACFQTFTLFKIRNNFSKATFFSLCTYIALPIFALIIQSLYYGLSFINFSLLLSMMIMFIVSYIEYYHRFVRSEREMNILRTNMMVSQIKPHFIYNSLSSIRYLCQSDASAAVNAIDEFSAYLRMNIDSIETQELIPLQKEIEHIKNYARLEQRRFGERVKIEFDIKDWNFLVPALSVQPIVENAVKHGITQKKAGGTILVSAQTSGGVHTITVSDNGVGFDTSVQQPQGVDAAGVQQPLGIETAQHQGTGLKNVRQRLETLCNGTMSVQSAVGKGTVVTITIPAAQVN